MNKIFWLFFLIPISAKSIELNPWMGLNIQKKIDSTLTMLWENQYRLFDGEYSELQWRLGLIYKVNENWSLAGGGFTSFNKDYNLQEFRSWQQIIYNYPVDDVLFLIRYRQEQRFFTKVDESAQRSRLQLRVNYKLSQIFTPYLATEFFIGLNESVKSNFPKGYNQNRIQIGSLIKINEKTNLESSLMRVDNQGMNKSTQNTVFWLSIQFRFY